MADAFMSRSQLLLLVVGLVLVLLVPEGELQSLRRTRSAPNSRRASRTNQNPTRQTKPVQEGGGLSPLLIVFIVLISLGVSICLFVFFCKFCWMCARSCQSSRDDSDDEESHKSDPCSRTNERYTPPGGVSGKPAKNCKNISFVDAEMAPSETAPLIEEDHKLGNLPQTFTDAYTRSPTFGHKARLLMHPDGTPRNGVRKEMLANLKSPMAGGQRPRKASVTSTVSGPGAFKSSYGSSKHLPLATPIVRRRNYSVDDLAVPSRSGQGHVCGHGAVLHLDCSQPYIHKPNTVDVNQNQVYRRPSFLEGRKCHFQTGAPSETSISGLLPSANTSFMSPDCSFVDGDTSICTIFLDIGPPQYDMACACAVEEGHRPRRRSI